MTKQQIKALYPERVVCVDCATLGMVSNYDSLISISACIMEDGSFTGEVFHRAVRPELRGKVSMEALKALSGDNFDTEAFDITQFSTAMSKIFPAEALPAMDVTKLLSEWANDTGAIDSPNIAHRASFDWAFFDRHLSSNTAKYQGPLLSPVWLCTKTMSRLLFTEVREMGLKALSKALGISAEKGPHESFEDAMLCGQCYWEMRKRLLAQ